MRYAYAVTSALLLGGAAIAMGSNTPVGAQTAQNDPAFLAAPPQPGAPVSFRQLAAKLQPAVVNISTKQTVRVQNQMQGFPFELFGMQAPQSNGPRTREAQSLGSGFLISSDGYIVTNNHVISAGQRDAIVESITVTMANSKEYKARLIGRDQASDLALLKIDATGLPFVQFGDSTKAQVGDWVMAIGNPYGLGGTVTAGIVSAVHRNTGMGQYDRLIQTDASINMGNSGGPMFDLNGNVIGINSSIYSPTGGNVGIGFAIPSEQAKPVIDALKSGARVERGYLGVGLQPLDERLAGAFGIPKNVGELIGRVEPGEGADKAGVKEGDIVTKVNGVTVTPDNTLSYMVANLKPGARVPLELVRNGRTMTVMALIGRRPPEDQLAAATESDGGSDYTTPEGGQGTVGAMNNSLGLAVVPLTPQIARDVGVPSTVRGAVIARVDPESDAAGLGLQKGDVILSANGVPITTAQELSAAVSAAKAARRDSIALRVQRGSSPAQFLGVKIK